jgi:hypothetical protein
MISTCSIDGCDKPTVARRVCGMHLTRIRRHGDPHTTLRPNWNTGNGWIDAHGYRRFAARNHPLSTTNGAGVAEHRLVLHAKLGAGEHPCHWCGRPLRWGRDLRAHHVNGDRDDNRPANIVPACASCILQRSRRVTTRGETRMKEHVVPSPQASSELHTFSTLTPGGRQG